MSEDSPLELFQKRVYRKSRSEASVNTYTRSFKQFLQHTGLTPEELVSKVRDGSVNVADEVNRWLDELNSRNLAPGTQKIYFQAVKKFVEVTVPENNVNWKTVDLPRIWGVEEDRIPTKQELRNILNHGNLKDRVIVLLAISSGLRIGTLADLKVEDLEFDTYEDVALIKVQAEMAKERVKYVTFTTPEAKKVLKQYLDSRRRKERELPPGSTVFNCGVRAIGMRWIRLLKKAGKTEKGRTFYKLHFHTLRKFFRTNLELAGVSRSFRERLLGHKGEYLDTAYFKPQIQALLNEYRKAIPQLTILEPIGEYEEIRKRQLLDTAKLLGFGEERLKRLEEVLARAKNVDEAVEEFKRLKEEPEDRRNQNSVKIVHGEKELLKHLENGWSLIKELNHDKYLLSR